MSQALRAAVVALLVADSALVSLLANDPNDTTEGGGSPAILWAQSSDAPPVFPALTYRIDTDTPDKRFRPTVVGEGPAVVRDSYITFTAWTRQPDSATGDGIGDRLRALLDNVALDLGDGAGRAFRSEEVSSLPDLWDKDLNSYYGIYRFRFRRRLASS